MLQSFVYSLKVCSFLKSQSPSNLFLIILISLEPVLESLQRIRVNLNSPSTQRNLSSGFQNAKVFIGYFEIKAVFVNSYHSFSVLVSILTELFLAHFTIYRVGRENLYTPIM